VDDRERDAHGIYRKKEGTIEEGTLEGRSTIVGLRRINELFNRGGGKKEAAHLGGKGKEKRRKREQKNPSILPRYDRE